MKQLNFSWCSVIPEWGRYKNQIEKPLKEIPHNCSLEATKEHDFKLLDKGIAFVQENSFNAEKYKKEMWTRKGHENYSDRFAAPSELHESVSNKVSCDQECANAPRMVAWNTFIAAEESNPEVSPASGKSKH